MNEELKSKLLELYNEGIEHDIKTKFSFKELFIIRDSLIFFNEKNGWILYTENTINKINDMIISLLGGKK